MSHIERFEHTLNQYRELLANTKGEELRKCALGMPNTSGLRVAVLRERLARLFALRDCPPRPALDSAYFAEMRANQ